uniref:Uncharacterized protein ycf37 n=1 Tax=Porphyra purpurea TaxID=2787 RepID=YCF37_PORPU|nr:ORF37 [Porphyra purpurea]P51191.1 RecName: Full=Uncharacterized protein ycf37 [Porphyra purpurea]AAC08077.1 hypothetical chloroplast ORF 37 [Porphyra purpurea]
MLVTLPIFYLSILTLFLLTFSWLISQQLKTIFLLESQFQYFLDKSKNDELGIEDGFAFSKVCIAKKYFTRAIIESHLVLKKNSLLESPENAAIIAKLYNMLGFIYYKADQKKLAKNFYERAIEVDGNYIVALNNLAKIYEDTKNILKAEALYDKVLNIAKSNKIANTHKKFIK